MSVEDTKVSFLTDAETALNINAWAEFLDEWFLLIFTAFLLFEFVRYIVIKKMSWNIVGDTITNYVTLVAFYFLAIITIGTFYIASYFQIHEVAIFEINTNWATVIICIVLADLIYYWEHRFMHRVNLAWSTHTVHHSSPYFNLSVAYRFGPLDGVLPIFFHIPLILLGFHPLVVIAAEIIVQLYQTGLHTEVVKKLPRPIELIMNTPSHHRVHHGSNVKYLDTNYAGIFIIWDRLFGTFVMEDEKVTYGLVSPINSINPVVVFFHGFYRVGKNVLTAKGLRNKLGYLLGPPEFEASSSPHHGKR